jgi:aldehyde dehydrogenase family 7 protein A1
LKGNFVQPTLIEISSTAPCVLEEHFVPVLYVMKVRDFEHAIEINNGVKQGLTSSLFTQNMKLVFEYLGPDGSDTGILNVNTSCSGAEIGGAFGGNKQTGGGRECGSDSWKQYMRRGTSTINFSSSLPLAQGVDFSNI